MTVHRANRHRGEIEAILGGKRYVLCLTLGALAELETAFEADNLMDLASRFSSGKLKADDVIRVLGAGLRGGGNLVSDEDVADMNLDDGIAGMAKIVVELLTATFAPQNTGAPTPNPTMPQPAPKPRLNRSRGGR